MLIEPTRRQVEAGSGVSIRGVDYLVTRLLDVVREILETPEVFAMPCEACRAKDFQFFIFLCVPDTPVEPCCGGGRT